MFLKNYFLFMDDYYSKTLGDETTLTSQLKQLDGTLSNDYAITYRTYGVHGIQLAYQNPSWYGSFTGSLFYISNNADNVFYGNQSYPYDYENWGLVIGDGNTPPTLDDYNLSDNIITDFSATTTISHSYAAGKLTIIATYNITNTGASAFTIREYGTRIRRKTSGNGAMLLRSLLETPLTINPGETSVMTVKITIQN